MTIHKKLAFFLIYLTGISCTTNKTDQKSFTFEYASNKAIVEWQKLDSIQARIKAPSFRNQVFNVVDYGAKGDSVTNDLPAFKKAIAECSSQGGGKINIPQGQYFLDGALHFQSNVNLHLEKGARLFFGQNPKKYLPAVKVRWEGTVCYNYSPLIYGYQLKNIAITGEGIIDGAAKEWSMNWREKQKPDKKRLRKMGNDTIPEIQRVFANGFLDLDGDGEDDGHGDGKEHYLRPTLIEFYECENILLSDFTIKSSPFWTVHPVFSKNVTIRNLKVFGEVLNDDGIDPDSCQDVIIEGCMVQTHDDAISVKAGRDQDAWQRLGSRNIIIRNNTLLSGVNALCIGSEMSGGVEYMFVEYNKISDGKHALNFKCNLDRGGQVQNIFIRNIEIESCREAMFIFRMDYHGYRGNNYPTQFNDFYVSDISCKEVLGKPFKIVGVEKKPIKRLLFNNIKIKNATDSSELKFAEELLFSDVFINGNSYNP